MRSGRAHLTASVEPSGSTATGVSELAAPARYRSLRYIRMAMGAKAAVRSAEATSTHTMSTIAAFPCMRPREAVTRCVTGL